MRQVRLIAGFAAILLAISSGYSLAASEIYRWVDDQGVVHFGERPPANTQSEIVDTRVDDSQGVEFDESESASGTTVDMAEQLREERAEARREAADKRVEIEAKCEQANAIIAQLEPFPRVMVTNEQGEVVRMDDNVRLEKLGQAKDFVAANCNK